MVNADTSVRMSIEEAEDAAFGMLSGRSNPSLKFTREDPPGSGNYVDLGVGTKYTGIVKENPTAYQAQDFKTKEPKTYKDGKPIMEVMIVLHCPQLIDPADSDDDGTRILRLNQHGKRALADEMRRLNGLKEFGPGTILTVEHVGYKPNPGERPSKLYNFTLENVQPRSTRAFEAIAAAGVPAAAQQQYVQPVQQPYVQPVQQPVYQQPVAAPAAPALDPALVAAAQAAAAAAPVPPVTGGLVVTAEHVAQVTSLMQMNIPREAAIEAVAQTVQGGPEFKKLLDNEIPF